MNQNVSASSRLGDANTASPIGQPSHDVTVLKSEDIRKSLIQNLNSKSPNIEILNLIAATFEFYVSKFREGGMVGKIDYRHPISIHFKDKLEFVGFAEVEVRSSPKTIPIFQKNRHVRENYVTFNEKIFLIKYYSDRVEALIAENDKSIKSFQGARKMQLPFKDAVEKHLLDTYGERLPQITLTDIYHDDRALYQAINSYKTRFKQTPFNIPSVREIAAKRFERVVSVGLENAERRDRDAAHRIAKRKAKSFDLD